MFELDDEAQWILGRPNFWCAGIARRLRQIGHKINERAEDEQAAVIHWMLGLREIHGDGWREAGAATLRIATAPKPGFRPDPDPASTT